MVKGTKHLAQFLSAPESVQTAFMRRLAEQHEAERGFRHWAEAVESDHVAPPAQPSTRLRPDVRWDDAWARRAARIARDPAGELDTERLAGIPAEEYVSALAGEEVRPGRPILCPLPDHDDTLPSFHVYPGDRGWYCHGCNRGGNIYNFAAALWEMDSRRDFRAVHERLAGVIA